jgi:hypothetical protein
MGLIRLPIGSTGPLLHPPTTPGYANDLVRYDASTLTWAPVDTLSPPSPRAYHGFAQALGRLFVFGGQDKSGGDSAFETSHSSFRFLCEFGDFVCHASQSKDLLGSPKRFCTAENSR